MSDPTMLEIQLSASLTIARSNAMLRAVTAELRRTMAENELLRAQLRLANLKIERRLRAVPKGTPALLRPQA